MAASEMTNNSVVAPNMGARCMAAGETVTNAAVFSKASALLF